MNGKDLIISGIGAVSPAGWGVPALMAALGSGTTLPTTEIERPLEQGTVRTPVLRVPADAASSPKFARLRRTSPISKFAAAAVAEALGSDRIAASVAGELRIGVIFTLTNGCVNYSNRFFGEALANPAIASPILFPETVFNAPSSHISAMIGGRSPNDTLVTDGAGFFSGMDLAAEWISRGDVDGCVVVASEEIDWLSAEALLLYSRNYLPSEGAAAVYLERGDGPVRVFRLPDPIPFSSVSRPQAARDIREILRSENEDAALLVDGTIGIPRIDRAETDAWTDWSGARLSPRRILGESMGAAAALQVVAAVASVRSGTCRQAVATAVGGNQQAAGLVIG
ncbi:beta-ketoacyl synthase N-terminal-like domain-containing protein [Luteolibacter sp. SL250]|uniref:beta-ketoacyl synthase N-terminal-like domain-containing protein n=1 Tax=Luteolibacter sp. SL250 TaxID=2995170 RepID=UPI002270EFB1|nr:beta-ketoacyl synthase N-terminal-like domain-containing protein [Luteolibacter sp. SL250]WAC18085.1 beta-ketoacyl synthase N-terminal-like domain-containing protein [Luteolibacter sp. SL250]